MTVYRIGCVRLYECLPGKQSLLVMSLAQTDYPGLELVSACQRC